MGKIIFKENSVEIKMGSSSIKMDNVIYPKQYEGTEHKISSYDYNFCTDYYKTLIYSRTEFTIECFSFIREDKEWYMLHIPRLCGIAEDTLDVLNHLITDPYLHITEEHIEWDENISDNSIIIKGKSSRPVEFIPYKLIDVLHDEVIKYEKEKRIKHIDGNTIIHLGNISVEKGKSIAFVNEFNLAPLKYGRLCVTAKGVIENIFQFDKKILDMLPDYFYGFNHKGTEIVFDDCVMAFAWHINKIYGDKFKKFDLKSLKPYLKMLEKYSCFSVNEMKKILKKYIDQKITDSPLYIVFKALSIIEEIKKEFKQECR